MAACPTGMRKVRAPQGRVPANGWWRRLQGECNREIPPICSVRVERCGKSAPAAWRLVRHVNPTWCKIVESTWGGPSRFRNRLSFPATERLDRWPFQTELGLQAALVNLFQIGKPRMHCVRGLSAVFRVCMRNREAIAILYNLLP